MDSSPPGFTVHGIFQARMLECPPPGVLPNPAIETCISCVSCIGRWLPHHLCPRGRHCTRHIVQINKFPRKHIGVGQHPSMFWELLWVRSEEGASLSGSESRCMGGSQGADLGHCHLDAQLGWRLCFQAGSLSWLCGEASVPDQLGISAGWETARFPQGQWPQRGRRKPPHQVWLGHSLSCPSCVIFRNRR